LTMQSCFACQWGRCKFTSPSGPEMKKHIRSKHIQDYHPERYCRCLWKDCPKCKSNYEYQTAAGYAKHIENEHVSMFPDKAPKIVSSPTSSSPFSFGAPSSTSTAPFSFGSSASTSTKASLFGAPSSTSTTPFLFGAPSSSCTVPSSFSFTSGAEPTLNKFMQEDFCEDNLSLNNMVPFFASCTETGSLYELLKNAGVCVDEVLRKAQIVATRAAKQGVLEKLNIEFEDALCIAAFTIEPETNKQAAMYNVINQALRKRRSEKNLSPVKNLIVHFLRCLRKLPRVTKNVVYRGIDKNIESRMSIGSTATWWGFTSTSWDMGVTSTFIKENGSLLVLDGPLDGYDITLLSEFPNESELLLEPETHFKIISKVNMGRMCVQCKIDTSEPVLLSLAPYRTESKGWSPFGTTTGALLDAYHSMGDPGLPPTDGIEKNNMEMFCRSYGYSDYKPFIEIVASKSVSEMSAFVSAKNRNIVELIFSFALYGVRLSDEYVPLIPDDMRALIRDLGSETFAGIITLLQTCVIGTNFEPFLAVLQSKSIRPGRVSSVLKSCGIPCRVPLDKLDSLIK